MKELTCEMCGSTNVVKQDGLFVCQSCGTKYSPEEAKKIMEGTVEVTGTVKVDSSSELDNLYEVARRARDSENNENALKYYDQILMKDSNSWEAQFYVVYFRAMVCKIAEIGISAANIYKSFEPLLTLIKDTVKDDNEQLKIIEEISNRSVFISQVLFNGAVQFYDDSPGYTVLEDCKFYASESFAIPFALGNALIEIFGDKYKIIANNLYKEGVQAIPTFEWKFDFNGEDSRNLMNFWTEKIKEVDSAYVPPQFFERNNGWCYVATSIYGSYDCPEVWTLRRFRDNILARTIYGRLFIKFYYAVSPTVVKYFGDTKVFKNFFKPRLDKLVSKLQEEGIESSYYIDE